MSSLERTELLPCEPMNLHQGSMESITSLAKRVAAENLLAVASLQGLLRKVLDNDHGQECSATAIVGDYRPFRLANSGGVVSVSIAKALEALTGLSSLLDLTLHAWNQARDAVPVIQVDGYRKWCPACYRDSVRNGAPMFDQLIWTIKGVNVCIIHAVELECRCRTCGAGPFAEITGLEASGFCSACGGWLGGNGRKFDPDHDDMARYLAWVASCCSSLLAAPRAEAAQGFEHLPRMLRAIAHAHCGNQMASLARTLGRPKSLIFRWANGTGGPRWNFLCQLSYVFGVPLLAILQGNTDAVGHSSVRRLPLAQQQKAPRRSKSSKTEAEIAELIADVAAGKRARILSIELVADELGMNVRSLRKASPETVGSLAAILAVRRRELAALQAQAHVNLLHAVLPAVVGQLHEAGIGVTRRALEEHYAKRGLQVPWSASKMLLGRARDVPRPEAGVNGAPTSGNKSAS